MDGDLFGATLIFASRIAAKSEGVEFVAKGFEGPVRVYEESWRS